MELLDGIKWYRGAINYSVFVEFIKGLEVIEFERVDINTYVNKLTKTKSINESTIRGILDVFLFNPTLKDVSMNYVLSLNTLKEINLFLCDNIDDCKLRSTSFKNTVNIVLFEKYIKNTLPVITNTRDLFSSGYYTYKFDNLHNYDINNSASTLLWKLHFIKLFDKHNFLTIILGITILNYNKTGELFLPILNKNGKE